ncbi:MFS transporter [Paenibacillus sambharensis]|nr:MFS transporter [Paenibacillus sambharensis]
MLILQAVDPGETGTAVGYISLFRSLGSTLGPTAAGLLLSIGSNGFSMLFLLSSLVSALSIILLLLFLKPRKPAAIG